MAATTISSVTLPGRGVRVMRRHGDTNGPVASTTHTQSRDRAAALGRS